MSGILPNWLERWLGVEAASPGEGTLWSLENTWSWAPWVTLLFAVFAVGWVVYFYAREGATAGRAGQGVAGRPAAGADRDRAVHDRRVHAVAAAHRACRPWPSWSTIRPAWASTTATTTRSSQALVASATAGGRTGPWPDRLNLAKTVLLDPKGTNLLAAIERHYRLKLYFVSSAARGAGRHRWPSCARPCAQARAARRKQPPGRRRAPRAERSARHAAGGDHPADRRHQHRRREPRPTPPDYARRKGVPLFTVGLGSEQPVRDLELADLLVDDVVFVDDVVNFEYKLTGHGLRRQDGRRRAARKGQPDGAGADEGHDRATTASRSGCTCPIGPRRSASSSTSSRSSRWPTKRRPDNNRQQRLVSVRKEQINVLLVQAYPNYEFRYLKNMLERDSTIQLKTVLQDADLEYAELDQTALRRVSGAPRGAVRLRRGDLRRRESRRISAPACWQT